VIECRDENLNRAPFRPMKFPDDIVIKKVSGANYNNSFALDTNGNLYVWGRKWAYDDYYGENDDIQEMFSEFKDCFTPTKMDWFEKHGYRILDFAVGDHFVYLRVKDKKGAYQMLGLVCPDYYYNAENYLGASITKLVDKNLWKIDSLSAEQISSFDCGESMSMICNKATE